MPIDRSIDIGPLPRDLVLPDFARVIIDEYLGPWTAIREGVLKARLAGLDPNAQAQLKIEAMRGLRDALGVLGQMSVAERQGFAKEQAARYQAATGFRQAEAKEHASTTMADAMIKSKQIEGGTAIAIAARQYQVGEMPPTPEVNTAITAKDALIRDVMAGILTPQEAALDMQAVLQGIKQRLGPSMTAAQEMGLWRIVIDSIPPEAPELERALRDTAAATGIDVQPAASSDFMGKEAVQHQEEIPGGAMSWPAQEPPVFDFLPGGSSSSSVSVRGGTSGAPAPTTTQRTTVGLKGPAGGVSVSVGGEVPEPRGRPGRTPPPSGGMSNEEMQQILLQRIIQGYDDLAGKAAPMTREQLLGPVVPGEAHPGAAGVTRAAGLQSQPQREWLAQQVDRYKGKATPAAPAARPGSVETAGDEFATEEGDLAEMGTEVRAAPKPAGAKGQRLRAQLEAQKGVLTAEEYARAQRKLEERIAKGGW